MLTGVLFSGKLVKGDSLEKLSCILKETFCVLDAIPLSSGARAITFALELFKKLSSHREKVILPVYICPSVVRAIKDAGLLPCFAPVNSNLNLDPDGLRGSLSKDVLAVIIPHIYGYPAPIHQCVRIVKEYDPSIFIIDDAAAAFGTTVAGQQLGTLGDVGIFSFGPSKKFTAIGGGALLITNADVLGLAHKHLSTIVEPSRREVFLSFMRFWWNFVCIRYSPVLNYWYLRYIKSALSAHSASPPPANAMNNLTATLILWLLEHNETIHRRRKQIMQYYIRELKELPGLSFPQENAPILTPQDSICVPRP